MIDGYILEKLCKKYNISLEKIINKNSLVLSRGNFDEIDIQKENFDKKLIQKIDYDNVFKKYIYT